MSTDVIDAMLDGVEAGTQFVDVEEDTGSIFTIYVMNSANFSKIPVEVYPQNTLGQIFIGYKSELGIKANEVSFQNTRTGESTVDSGLTVKEFGLDKEDVLSIIPDGVVA